MGKKSKRYISRKKDARRRRKRHSRKQATFSEPELTTDRGEPELTDKIVAASVVAATQGARDSTSASSARGKEVEDNQLQSKDLRELKANYDRVRQMLYEEQRKPRNIYLECATCMQRRSRKAELARQSLRARMFSGDSVGSRQLLAALRYHC